ncbi:hypothetical protein E3U55_01565 [Filobacillus milosensis]|uniref:Uncharacterized protein n=1 Tax=Filobacillus milosensis TaxID=94137 RepID=A0A4Y8IT25_9BACI|nr:hypothetical protein [Filobacillus milosensis]TFB25108.1 hypothetical protein E3U55_01565 [Filobacillus milosensis]
MGTGYGIRCQSCFYSNEFLLGVGGDYTPFIDYEFNILHPKTREQVKRVIGGSPIHDINYEYELLSCLKCQHLYSRPIMEIKYDRDEKFTTNKNCSKCKGKGKIISNIEIDINQLKCPGCKRKKLEINSHIMWD